MCPREEVLVRRAQITRRSIIDASLLFAFDAGSEYHWALQNKVLGPLGILLGVWRCTACGRLTGEPRPGTFHPEHQQPCPAVCARCHGKDFEYVEQLFRDQEHRVAGHPDGFLRLPGRADLGILEAKSISPNGLKDVRKIPQYNHRLQLHVYLWLTGLQWGTVLYWSKGSWGLDAFVEHFVERDETIVTSLKAQARAVWEALQADTLTERICATPTCSRASDCPVAPMCFAQP